MTADDAPLPGLEPAEGRTVVPCRLCGHPLTAKEARLWGFGRDCRRKLGLDTAPQLGRFDVEQDGLFGT